MNTESHSKSKPFWILGVVFVLVLLIDWALAPLLEALGVASASWGIIVSEGVAYILLAIFATWLYTQFIDRQATSFRRFELYVATAIVIATIVSFGILLIFKPGGFEYANLSPPELAENALWGLVERLVPMFLVFGIANPILFRKK